ncbi:hypothetical protein TREMEDRAFT_70764 [Tremella mesenterica DSM 1558]|uniref:uncharacterized protein n=1 Tax=Tremella mesenterica (strain ATCC 24925 / CBS 8224 / DSM 1558 / NBRC 9311 / NRRL Y-6157 / RJB 2259-6 / UBC 559-6) TaxID=578456 RepID=UPI0003F490F8|nr:uncharacterized protein TREMEDRAFT_70764 [Tremella mesenterica DSM 1558]EIW72611.1 hypothetical protein TREMEDRAFT_70764 [Tremella mesenterica DSM 1558]
MCMGSNDEVSCKTGQFGKLHFWLGHDVALPLFGLITVQKSALSALLSRLSLPPSTSLHPTLQACLTHPSFVTSSTDASGSTAESEEIQTNEVLSSLGNSLLGLFASEKLAVQYPLLPTEALKLAVTAFVGPHACFSVARELGLGVNGEGHPTGGVTVRWVRPQEEIGEMERKDVVPLASRFKRFVGNQEGEGRVGAKKKRESFEDVVADTVRAFVGLIYQEKGIHSAREFVHAHFLSRHLDMTTVFTFKHPKHMLASVVAKQFADAGIPLKGGMAKIESRILASTGINSQAPLFNIGLFLPSGLKLSEGHGSSLRMAEHRAAVNALLSFFLLRGDVGHRFSGIMEGVRQTQIGEMGEGLPSGALAQWPVKDGELVGDERESEYRGVSWGGGEGVVDTGKKGMRR